MNCDVTTGVHSSATTEHFTTEFNEKSSSLPLISFISNLVCSNKMNTLSNFFLDEITVKIWKQES